MTETMNKHTYKAHQQNNTIHFLFGYEESANVRWNKDEREEKQQRHYSLFHYLTQPKQVFANDVISF